MQGMYACRVDPGWERSRAMVINGAWLCRVQQVYPEKGTVSFSAKKLHGCAPCTLTVLC